MINRQYKNKLSHLTKEDIEDLMWFYYEGEEEDLLIAEYNIDMKISSLLYRAFPLIEDYNKTVCPYCNVILAAYSQKRYSSGLDTFCQKCNHLKGDVYTHHCECENCSKERKQVIQAIKMAFGNVILRNGVGLFEGQGIDGYESSEVCQKLRSKDERSQWQKIPSKHLNQCYSSLSFFDAEGMLFHLPAFMLLELEEGSGYVNIVFHLTHSTKISEQKKIVNTQFSLLNSAQKKAVRFFLQHLLNDIGHEYDWPSIERSLNSFWQ